MEILWAPWRLEFILGEKPKGCIFCTLETEKTDKENLILWRGQHCFIIMNKFPYNNGHVMVIPNHHTDDLSSLNAAVQSEFIWATGECVRIVKETLGAHAANCGMNLGHDAGAGVLGHLHMHIVPRWRGDCNFMPMIAETKCMPEYLATTYDRLHPAFQTLKK
ncbi:MAG: HIT family hydrolase [Deltaproteobacteria bacterium CG11_big_fil_rev_8_21_14_0_20_47_16]|nr:MAG: HIT family hydrolase [Deltaproteobacteria bacterium CG11_big_fil_rev_8_21_14_0_20_47_16]